jgi:hypothetical protein
MATIRHFGKWLYKETALPGGDPCQGLRAIPVDEPSWNGHPQKNSYSIKSCLQNAAKRM